MIENLVDTLRVERDQRLAEAKALDTAIEALASSGHNGTRNGAITRTRTAPDAGIVRRTMSASARRKIAAAQRARWAKVRKGQ